MKKRVYIYTSIYPYSIMAESFLGEELKVASQFDCEVTLVPIGKDAVKREIPDGIILDNSLCERSFIQNLRAFLGIFKPLCLKELIYNPARPFKLKFILDTCKYLFASNLVYNHLSRIAKNKQASIFYSYWTSYTPIAFADYKRKHKNTTHKFICRSHTFASFGTSVVDLYYPMRDFVFKWIDKFYVISSVLYTKLQEVYPQYAEKFILSRLGVTDNAGGQKDNSDYIELLSCSSVIPLKRIDLIYSSIKGYASVHPDQQFRWTHIGDGPLMEELKRIVKQNQTDNLIVDLRGALPNNEILQFYMKKRIHALILLSIREGLPVVLMEAISSGIPVIATKVGGIPDLVNDQTGRMVNRDFTVEEFNNALQWVLDNNDTLSKTCHEFYLTTFNSEQNYRSFYKSILAL